MPRLKVAPTHDDRFRCSTLVWWREVAHEAGTVFAVVVEPLAALEVDAGQADAWARNGWGEYFDDPSSALRAPSSPSAASRPIAPQPDRSPTGGEGTEP